MGKQGKRAGRVKLKSRWEYGKIVLIPVSENEYTLQSNFGTARVGFNGDKDIIFIDPPGGHMLSVGEIVEEIGEPLHSIKEVEGKGFILSFESNDISSDQTTEIVQ